MYGLHPRQVEADEPIIESRTRESCGLLLRNYGRFLRKNTLHLFSIRLRLSSRHRLTAGDYPNDERTSKISKSESIDLQQHVQVPRYYGFTCAPYGLTGVVRQIRVRGITRVQVVEMPRPGGQLELPQNAGHVVIGTGDEQRFAIPAGFNGRDRLD
jgi:hypothetical protein